MAETSNFALRMPPELKEAAKALSNVYFDEIWLEDGKELCKLHFFGSINESLIFLMRKGLDVTLELIEKDIARNAEEMAMWQEFVSFFMQNAAARNALPANFAPGSKARGFLTECMEEDPEGWGDGIDRAYATDEFASKQRKVFSLTEVKGFIQKALGGK